MKLISKFKSLKLKYKIIIGIAIAIILLSTFSLTLGRYVYDNLRGSYLASQNFYFNSDKLAKDGANYQLNNWSGVEEYTIVVNMNSRKNNIKKAASNINYDITYTCSNTVTCAISKSEGLILASTNIDSFTLTVTPATLFNDGDQIEINITASSTSPYTETLTGRFVLSIGKIGLSYEITDESNRAYLDLRITNTLDYYNVITAFDTYSVGDRIDIATYQTFTQNQKDNCASVIVNLSFDPNLIILDMTANEYINRTAQTTTTINGFDYINGFSFKMDAILSNVIRFYKANKMTNYTYPFNNANSVITLTYS